jgi:hypothetical protein
MNGRSVVDPALTEIDWGAICFGCGRIKGTGKRELGGGLGGVGAR